ncbi:hypothetical protein J6590_062881 [Homalodisca vitripennis]|nr:hypothetical protein J6590_062881 [Homalodisca vitripennis]
MQRGEYPGQNETHSSSCPDPPASLGRQSPPKKHPECVLPQGGAFPNVGSGRMYAPHHREHPGNKCSPVNRSFASRKAGPSVSAVLSNVLGSLDPTTPAIACRCGCALLMWHVPCRSRLFAGILLSSPQPEV